MDVVACHTDFAISGTTTGPVFVLDHAFNGRTSEWTMSGLDPHVESYTTRRGILSPLVPSYLMDASSVFMPHDAAFYRRGLAFAAHGLPVNKQRLPLALSEGVDSPSKVRPWCCVQTDLSHHELDSTTTGFIGKPVDVDKTGNSMTVEQLLERYPNELRVLSYVNKYVASRN